MKCEHGVTAPLPCVACMQVELARLRSDIVEVACGQLPLPKGRGLSLA
jgi:hypothetical protein